GGSPGFPRLSLAYGQSDRHHERRSSRDRGRRGRRTSVFGRSTVPTRGVVYVHSTPLAVCPHVEWAIARVLCTPVRLEWSAQPVEPSARRAEYVWSGRPGTGGEIAAALRQWSMLRFEVTEEPSPGVDGERFMHVPGRGLFRASTSANGD